MRLVRLQRPGLLNWLPFEQLAHVREEMNRLFESPLGDAVQSPDLFGGWTPAVDLYEDNDHLIVRAELPGMSKESIDISLHEGVLTLAGERKAEDLPAGSEAYRSERFYGRFQRTLDLPKPVEADRVSAHYRDGILTITLPKTEEAKPRQIEVNIG
jgi:HSP20 family protein